MIKCLLIYLWIYIGLFYMIEAGEDDEHVHIKLHMTGGQRKRAQIQPHTHQQHHKKRHANLHHHHQHHHHHTRPHQQQHSHPLPPPVATTTTDLYHDSPHNYLTGITATSSSSLLPQNHVFQSAHTKKFPSSSPLNLHESGQLLNIEEDVFGQGDVVGDAAVVSVDTVDGEAMTIPSYLTKNFASFPLPTTTYETEIIPHNSEGFTVVGGGLAGLEDTEEDNEITAPAGRAKGSLESLMLAEQQMENYRHHHQHHKPSALPTKSSKNEQLFQHLLQQQENEQPEIMNMAAYKSAKLRANKYKAEKDYHSEDDLTEAIMFPTSTRGTRHKPAASYNRPIEEDLTANSGSIKTLTVDDIWSQLQQQYLSKYSPQAQPLLAAADSDEQSSTATKTKPKRKRNTKRQRHARPSTITSYSTSWPAKTLSYTGNSHHSKQYTQPIKLLQQQQQYYDDLPPHSPPSAAAFSGLSLSSSALHRDADFFAKRPFNKFHAHTDEDDHTGGPDEEPVIEFGELGEEQESEDEDGDDDFDVYGDASFEEAVYQRGKKFAGHQHSQTNNPFSSHDLYGSFSTPVTATVEPSTYHPNLVAPSSTLPSFTSSSSSSSTNAFLPTLSHPSTSYQWHTQQNYPASYQTYRLQHQQQPPSPPPLQWAAAEQYVQQQTSAALRFPKATIIQTPNTLVPAKLSPTQSNDFAGPSSSSASSASSAFSSSSSSKSTTQTPARYKKRKNRIKPKRNRIVVI